MSQTLQTIICSTRPGRIGPSLATWFHEYAQQHGGFHCQLVDIAAYNLPVYDEPNHPAQQKYEHEHTKRWSQTISEADAYVFVIPEYNGCPPPSFFNALNYLFKEWNHKPCGFLSYGGASGGLKSATMAKQLVTTLKMVPVTAGVMVQMPWNLMDDEKAFQAGDHHTHSASAMLDDLAHWGKALTQLR